MATGVRVAVVGGGSSYTPELMAGFIRHYHEMPVERITLIDVPLGQHKQDIVREFSQRLWDQANLPIRLEATLDRHEALESADFVCHQFRVGGLQARQRDETLPLRYHALGQETCGAGGCQGAQNHTCGIGDSQGIRRAQSLSLDHELYQSLGDGNRGYFKAHWHSHHWTLQRADYYATRDCSPT